MAHDFKKHPELKDGQMQFYYFESPHKQITEGFLGKVVKVTDGDTIRVETDFRDFTFPVRLSRIAAPEIKEEGGLASAKWLAEKILGEEVYIKVNPHNRVGKWGRIIGDVMLGRESMSE
ncbi:MAG: hypothetical protein U9O94_10250, partial [Nanoarchaeota archaeon]|nr:hypothetical protein [Nanoarchaeota archaeon]